MRALLLGSSLLYLLLAHAATLSGRPQLRVAAAVVLCALLFVLLRARPWLQLLLAAALALLLLLADDPLRWLLYAPPVLVPLALAALVARSLAPGRQPVIERIVWHMHGQPAQLSPAHVAYARAVTGYWCGVFVAMAGVNAALAAWAPPALWSWVGNFGTYGMPVLALLAEYAWRKRVFPIQQYRNLFDYLARVVRLGPILGAELFNAGRHREAGHVAPAVRR